MTAAARRALLALLLLMTVSVASASGSASALNLSGTWSSVYHCKTGGCAGQDFPSPPSPLFQAAGSSIVTSGDGASTGTLVGHTLSLQGGSSGYSYSSTLTISADGRSWTGTLTDSNGTSGTDTGTRLGGALKVLALGKRGEAATVSGSVNFETPGQTTFAPLTSSTTVIPMGSMIDATGGTVKLTVAKAHGKGMQTGEFYSGEFKLTQSHSGLTKETLEGGSPTACTTTGARRLASTASAAKGTPTRQLWGHAHGSFSTSGRGGAATVLGTIWLTQDYCNGTLFKAVKDSITVVNFAHPHKKHHIAQGHSFFAALSGA